MNDLLKIMRLAVCLFALPLIVTAVVSAEALFSYSDGLVKESEFLTRQPVKLEAKYGSINHRLTIDDGGGVSGQIMHRNGNTFEGASSMKVTLNQRGQTVAETQTGNDGIFHFENIIPGAYSFIATSENNITTFGVYIEDTGTLPSKTIQFSVSASAINTNAVREILNSDVEGVTYQYLPSANELTTFSQVSRVQLSDNNGLAGRVLPLLWEDRSETFDLTGNQVYLLDGSGLVANSKVSADGSFNLSDIAPGNYDFVAFGPHGAATFSMEITPSEGDAQFRNANYGSAKNQDDELEVVLSETTEGEMDDEDDDEEDQDSPIQEAVIQQPFVGGYGGGGGYGSGGGFGDWGSIIGLGLGAWVLSEVFNSNNNSQVIQPPVVIPPPQSPF